MASDRGLQRWSMAERLTRRRFSCPGGRPAEPGQSHQGPLGPHPPAHPPHNPLPPHCLEQPVHFSSSSRQHGLQADLGSLVQHSVLAYHEHNGEQLRQDIYNISNQVFDRTQFLQQERFLWGLCQNGLTWMCWMSCTVERRVVPELERKDDLRRCSLRARGPPALAEAPTSSVCSSLFSGR